MNEIRELEKTIDTLFVALPYLNNLNDRKLIEDRLTVLSTQYQERTGYYYVRKV